MSASRRAGRAGRGVLQALGAGRNLDEVCVEVESVVDRVEGPGAAGFVRLALRLGDHLGRVVEQEQRAAARRGAQARGRAGSAEGRGDSRQEGYFGDAGEEGCCRTRARRRGTRGQSGGCSGGGRAAGRCWRRS